MIRHDEALGEAKLDIWCQAQTLNSVDTSTDRHALLAQRLASGAGVLAFRGLQTIPQQLLPTALNPIIEAVSHHSHQTWHVHLAALDRPIILSLHIRRT